MTRLKIAGADGVENRFLLNFAASYSEGGYKRLHAYAQWFNAHGGAWFIVHPHCLELSRQFPHNQFFSARASHLERMFHDCAYLEPITRVIGQPEVYYAYGIPLYRPIARINWFHLSNVLPLGTRRIPLHATDRLKFHVLGRRIRRGFQVADIISAESRSSLDLIDPRCRAQLVLSVNGSDDELACLGSPPIEKDNIATVVGTYRYKSVADSWRIFETLRKRDPALKLAIIGNPDWIPTRLRSNPHIIVRGALPRSAVIDCLRRSRYYLSATRVENSYNAAAEGIFLADESYISDIGPHRELLLHAPLRKLTVPSVGVGLLHVRRSELSSERLKTWDSLVSELQSTAREAMDARGSRTCVPIQAANRAPPLAPTALPGSSS